MHYPTHCLGLLTGVTRERIRRVSCLDWGGGRPWFDDNDYNNPFWNQRALMQTDKGHMVRCNVFRLVGGHGERARLFGERGSLHMAIRGLNEHVWAPRSTALDRRETLQEIDVPDYWKSEMLPAPMRHGSGHDGSHAYLAAEFVNALLDDR